MSDAAVREAFRSMDENENIFRSCLGVDRHVSFLTGFEDEDVGGQHSFLGPECGRDLDGGHLAFGSFDLPKCFGVENFSSAFEYEEMTIDHDAVDSPLVAEEKAKTEKSDKVQQGTDERTKHGEGNLQCLSRRRDDEVTNQALTINNGPSVESFVRQTFSPQSELTEGRDCFADEHDMHREICTVTESYNCHDISLLDRMTVRKLQDAFRNIFGRETKIRDKQWLKRRILFGIQNSGEVHKPLNFVDLGVSPGENEGKSMSLSGTDSCVISPCSPKLTPDSETKVYEKIKESISDSSTNYSSEASETGISFQCKEEKDDGLVKGKRVHKPPRRYIEETIEVKPRKFPKRSGVSIKRSKDRLVDDKLHKQHEEKVDGSTRLVRQAGSFDGACIQVPFGLPVEEENFKETASYKVSDIIPKDDHPAVSTMRCDAESPAKVHIIPEDEPLRRSPVQKGTRRRKHHMPWTLSEVMRLIEGVSHLGVGRWSKIKRLLFATSKHRTSVDLKDKWRNLVKASTHLRRKRKGIQARKQLTHQAPESVLRRVRELASSHQ